MVSRLESNQACPPKIEKTNLECRMVIEPERQKREASRPFQLVHPQEHRRARAGKSLTDAPPLDRPET